MLIKGTDSKSSLRILWMFKFVFLRKQNHTVNISGREYSCLSIYSPQSLRKTSYVFVVSARNSQLYSEKKERPIFTSRT